MLTPIELHNAEHKTGRGYSKKEMDAFLEDVFESYETLYKENAELKEKLTQLSEGVQYYKSMESTLQKALVLAEKTSKDTIDSANSKAELIEKEANIKAERIISNAQMKVESLNKQCIELLQQYNQFKAQLKQIAIKQIELLDSDFYEIYSKDLIDAIQNTEKEEQNEDQKNVTNSDTKDIEYIQKSLEKTISDIENNNDENKEDKKDITENDSEQSDDDSLNKLFSELKKDLSVEVNKKDSEYEFMNQ